MWDKKHIEMLKSKRQEALNGGGAKRIEKQHALGKLTARERIELLFDSGTFTEVDALVKSRTTDFDMQNRQISGDGVVVGYGEINGKLAFASSQDFTVIGGSLGEYHSLKICRIMDMALEMKAPFISINDSGGARIEEGICSLSGYSGIFLRNTRASGIIPQISVILGPCAGGACYSPAICDFVFMAANTSQMFITGPSVVKAVTGENATPSELGGAGVQSQNSGVAHFVYPDDKSCLDGVRELLSYLPQNNEEAHSIFDFEKVDNSDKIENIVPKDSKKAYDVHKIIETFADKDSFLEVQPDFAKNIVIGFIKFEGRVLGVVANQPSFLAGSLDINASDKAARFIRFCDCFNIPLLTLVDVPGFLPGIAQEHNGIIRHGAKILYAYSEATVPKVSLIMRKAYGGAYIAMNSKNMGADMVFAWPISEIAVMGSNGAVDIMYKKEISESQNPQETRAELIKEYEEKFMSPYIAAERGYVDEVIFPEETRERLSTAFKMLQGKSATRLNKKHGNIPL